MRFVSLPPAFFLLGLAVGCQTVQTVPGGLSKQWPSAQTAYLHCGKAGNEASVRILGVDGVAIAGSPLGKSTDVIVSPGRHTVTIGYGVSNYGGGGPDYVRLTRYSARQRFTVNLEAGHYYQANAIATGPIRSGFHLEPSEIKFFIEDLSANRIIAPCD